MPQRDFPFPLTPELAERFARWVADPWEAAPPKRAATVMLLRDGDADAGAGGVEVFMQRRVASMAFAPRRYVFPGGSLDAGDREAVPWAGPSPAEWADVLGVDAAEAVALVTAAAREVFEESGVLLAGPAAEGVVAEGCVAAGFVVGEASWRHTARGRLLAREVTFAGLLREAGLALRSDALGFAAHWITPEVEPRRYDTFFFTALLPPGQEADAETTEADLADWMRPVSVIEEARAGLMPPTLVCLEALTGQAEAADIVRRRAPVPVIMPVPVRHGDGWAMRVQL